MSIEVGEETIHFETGQIARQANGAVIARAGDTMVFTSACAAKDPTPAIDFLPLRVDYTEKFSAAGKTLGGFIKREGKPTERETLVCRLIDRPIRPMFADGWYNETQIISYVFSYDGINSPEPLTICSASAALVLSDIPLVKPIAAVRVGYVNGKFILNPTIQHQQESKLDLVIAGTEDAVLMIEGYADFLTEEEVLEAIRVGHVGIAKIAKALGDWQKKIGKPKRTDCLRTLPQEVINEVERIAKPHLEKALKIRLKQERETALSEIDAIVKEALLPADVEPKFDPLDVKMAIKQVQAKYLRRQILDENYRADGRDTKSIRTISIEQALLPRVHGSSLFTRGETQALAVCTLGGEGMAQRFEDLQGEGARRFYMQYSFPPFSVGEVGRQGPPGRREVGHGKLAERSLMAILPKQDEFAYTIRLESNITESNGSSSMASVCGGCLAMMDAGVPIKRPVSGIAMGLILEKDECAILSDILGIEDALGDMDFKVAGDKEGITAFQMDIKIEGITFEIMKMALEQAKEGRIHILNKMLEACPESKKNLSAYAPRIETIKIKPSKIGIVIGPGGKQIRAIVEETGCQVDINDEGIVSLTSPDEKSIMKARAIIEGLVAEVEVGKVYDGKIVKITDFGCFVEVLPGKEGLCHISEFDTVRINNLNDHAKPGDKVKVKVLEINDRGQIRLSRKVLLAS